MGVQKTILVKTAMFVLKHPKKTKNILKIVPQPVKKKALKFGIKRMTKSAGKIIGETAIELAIPLAAKVSFDGVKKIKDIYKQKKKQTYRRDVLYK